MQAVVRPAATRERERTPEQIRTWGLHFRVARAEAAGATYRENMLELRDTGRHLQAGDTQRRDRDATDTSD